MNRRDELLHRMMLLLRDSYPQGLNATEIARRLGVSRSTIMCFLPQLERQGFVLWEDPDGRLGVLDQELLPKQLTGLDQPLQKLNTLLANEENEEAKYQNLLQDHPWMLGGQYKAIERHRKLDDENIPDFTGVRAWDGCRDIFEIKPPFMRMFRNDGEFTSEFNQSWNQAERYLDFVRLERDYLQRKGLNFDNPTCFLVLGYNLSEGETKKVQTKQRMNSSILLLTYDHLLALVQHTIDLVRKLKADGETAE